MLAITWLQHQPDYTFCNLVPWCLDPRCLVCIASEAAAVSVENPVAILACAVCMLVRLRTMADELQLACTILILNVTMIQCYHLEVLTFIVPVQLFPTQYEPVNN